MKMMKVICLFRHQTIATIVHKTSQITFLFFEVVLNRRHFSLRLRSSSDSWHARDHADFHLEINNLALII